MHSVNDLDGEPICTGQFHSQTVLGVEKKRSDHAVNVVPCGMTHPSCLALETLEPLAVPA